MIVYLILLSLLVTVESCFFGEEKPALEEELNDIIIYSILVLHAVLIVTYLALLFFLSYVLKRFFMQQYSVVQCPMHAFLLSMILSLAGREVVFILIYV